MNPVMFTIVRFSLKMRSYCSYACGKNKIRFGQNILNLQEYALAHTYGECIRKNWIITRKCNAGFVLSCTAPRAVSPVDAKKHGQQARFGRLQAADVFTSRWMNPVFTIQIINIIHPCSSSLFLWESREAEPDRQSWTFCLESELELKLKIERSWSAVQN